jgi:beta-lactamase regulating signal transducer with metallopeptidase domain
MSSIREVLFNLLLNACLQIALFAIVAAAFSRLVAQAKAKYQYSFYLSVLVLCLVLPVVNTLWHAHPFALAEKFSPDVLHETQSPDQDFWIWKGHSKAQHRLAPGTETEDVLLAIWAALILYRLIHFGRGLRRVHRVRNGARLLSPAEIGAARSTLSSQRVALLASADIANPVTVGVLRPAVILPSKLIPALGKYELAAIFAHEYAHIRRRDFPVHIVCEAVSLPVALHPGIRYLMSKISQTRELACDEQAAVQLGERRFYARTLLRLASLCLQASPENAVGLGIFDGDNLEDRIMILTKKRTSLSRASLIGLVLAIGVTFGSGAVFARATSRQTTGASDVAQSFAGTWHWMFQGKSFSTMTLTRNGSGLTGSVTESRIALNDDGGLKKADASDDTTPKQITKAELEGSMLRVKVADGFEFTMVLKDDTHAEIIPGGAPPNMKPIPLEKAH